MVYPLDSDSQLLYLLNPACFAFIWTGYINQVTLYIIKYALYWYETKRTIPLNQIPYEYKWDLNYRTGIKKLFKFFSQFWFAPDYTQLLF